MGFSVPIGTWLRGPLREWAEELLEAGSLRKDPMLNATLIRTLWAEHLSGQRDCEHKIWSVLMYRAWSARWN